MKFKRPKPLGSSSIRAYAELARAREDAFQLYVGPLRPPSHLFHFSSLGGIKAILKSGTLWASDVRLMKDKTELQYATDLLQDVASHAGHYFEEVRHSLAKELLDLCVHISCLTMEPLLRSQWMDYADSGQGCAISFDFHEIKAVRNIGSFPLAYDPKIQREMLEAIYGARKNCRFAIGQRWASTPRPSKILQRSFSR